MDLSSGIIWEPRVLWDVARQDNITQLGGSLQVKFNKYNFRNGGQYPIELHHLLVAPVGYVFNEYDGQNIPATATVGDYGACAAVIQKSSLMFSMPNRQHYSLMPLQVGSWIDRCSEDVPMRYNAAVPWSSGLHGTVRWDFAKNRRLVLPRNAVCTLQLGAYLGQPSGGFGSGLAKANVAFFEGGVGHEGSQQFMWNCRARALNQLPLLATSSVAVFPWQPADGLGTSVGNSGAEYPGGSGLQEMDYKQQESARDGYNAVSGYAVSIDQILYDDSVASGGPANSATAILAPLAHRIPCRARSNAMSQEWWWRDGAPLSLVCPTLTPALVYDLPEPLTLGKGEHIEVEMQTPGGLDAATDVFSIFQIGVSFAGYAAVEG